MYDRSHPVWFVLFLLVVGGLGLGYCSLAYANGVDIAKDGGLIAIITAASGLWFKFTGGEMK